MTLFQINPNYREKATIWRIFSLLPLFGNLAEGRVFRWFAVNIPMDLGTGGDFTSDIDIMARLHDYPNSHNWLYKTWEVKVGLLCKDGTARSLKRGKTRRLLTQLSAYRDFGSPDVGLLDTYLCEAGLVDFPPNELVKSVSTKLQELNRNRFGYRLLPFGHDEDENGEDATLRAWVNTSNPFKTILDLESSALSPPQQPFSRFADRLNTFFENSPDCRGKSFKQIVWCRKCRELQLIRMRDEHRCPTCSDDLIVQS